MDTRIKVGIGIAGALAVGGTVVYLVNRPKKKSPRRPRRQRNPKRAVRRKPKGDVTLKAELAKLPVVTPTNMARAEEIARALYAREGSHPYDDLDQVAETTAQVMEKMYPGYRAPGAGGWPTTDEKKIAFVEGGYAGALMYNKVWRIVQAISGATS